MPSKLTREERNARSNARRLEQRRAAGIKPRNPTPTKEQRREAMRRYALEHPDKIRAARKKYKEANRDKINAAERERNRRNPRKYIPKQLTPERKAELAARQKMYRLNNLDKYRAYGRQKGKAYYHQMTPEQKARHHESAKKAKVKYEKIHAARLKEYRREREKQRVRIFTKEQKERMRQASERRKRENPQRFREQATIRAARRKARQLANTETQITPEQISVLYLMQGKKCGTCKTRIFKTGPHKYEIDHVMPLARGGAHHIDNLQLLCRHCNRSKHAKHPDEWAKKHGLLFC
jgi:5-methylcytosine-specific restriction endonuclease McrA